MSADIIKFFSIFFCTIFVCLKNVNRSAHNSFIYLVNKIIPLLLAFFTTFLNYIYPEITYTLPLLVLWLYISIITEKPKEMFISVLLSFGISFCTYATFNFMFVLLLYTTYKNIPSFPYSALATLTSILHIVSITWVFKIKRFKRSMLFFHKKSFINIGNIICLFLIAFLMYIESNRTNPYTQLLGIISFTITLAFLIHWWQAQITKSYKQSLVMRELDSLRVEVEEKDKEISRLKAQNEELGRLIHHDNKRIPAMEHAVCEYLVSDFNDVTAMKERANTLRLEIEQLSRNRSNTLKEIYTQKSKHYSTGISALDTLLNYMDKRASEKNISFVVHNALNLVDYIPKSISTEDLTHMLSDLLENALIATEPSDCKMIQLQFYISEKHLVVEVADSGIPFETKSIVNFGLSRLTTHEATGGSGIGLMDIWKIKEKYGATLHIEEYETVAPFTKKISMVFNHKNMYSVRTYRAEELSTLSKRNDLKIYTFND